MQSLEQDSKIRLTVNLSVQLVYPGEEGFHFQYFPTA